MEFQAQKVEKSFIHLLQLRHGIIGDSPQIRSAVEILNQAAPTDLSILITGETGTGKEVFAHAIHNHSDRKKFPFVSVNCGAIPENLLESELFGHEKGAFTGAVEQRKGFFEAAHRGTIFLDEIGDMPFGTQVKLLRVLESGEFSRLGSTIVQKVDVRIVAATNRDLELDVKDGRFRQDLFFRLNSVQIKLPALRTHPQDVPILIEHFAEKTCEKLNMKYAGVSDDAVSILKTLPWPGNIRELRNMVETIVTLEKGSFITAEIISKYIPRALPEYRFEPTPADSSLMRVVSDTAKDDNQLMLKTLLEIKNDISEVKRALNIIGSTVSILREEVEDIKLASQANESGHGSDPDKEPTMHLGELEKDAIERALEKYHTNRRMAAQALGISERTLYRKLIEYGIE